MKDMWLRVFLLLLLLLTSRVLCQREELDRPWVGPKQARQQDADLLNINILSTNGALGLLPAMERRSRAQRQRLPAPKRNPQGSRFALSLDVPTSILSVLIDLAKDHDMRAKAAANAELMARIGKRR